MSLLHNTLPVAADYCRALLAKMPLERSKGCPTADSPGKACLAVSWKVPMHVLDKSCRPIWANIFHLSSTTCMAAEESEAFSDAIAVGCRAGKTGGRRGWARH